MIRWKIKFLSDRIDWQKSNIQHKLQNKEKKKRERNAHHFSVNITWCVFSFNSMCIRLDRGLSLCPIHSFMHSPLYETNGEISTWSNSPSASLNLAPAFLSHRAWWLYKAWRQVRAFSVGASMPFLSGANSSSLSTSQIAKFLFYLPKK